jgi:uridylate kinase
MKDVEISLRKNKVIFCGALRYAEKETSDGTAAKLAKFLKASFINMSNVKGLYNKNPNKFKNAKFIPRETWKKFKKRALKIKFKPGQHFVLDQNAAVIIEKNKIKTYLIGKNTINLHNLLNHKKFIGTVIEG